MQFIKIFRKRFHHLDDVWDAKAKDAELKVGVFQKSTIGRSIPGNWKNAFGTVAIEKGVNIWMLKVKKKDSARKFVSVMFGVIRAEHAHKSKLEGCFAYGNGDGVDGWGFYAANGCIYHGNKYGQPYLDGYQVGHNDIICVVLDFYRGTLTFDVTPAAPDELATQSTQPKIAFQIDRKHQYKLAVSMRGCDEIQLLTQ